MSKRAGSYDRKDRQYLYSSLPLDAIVERREITLEKDEFLLLSYNEKAIPIDIEREKIEYCRTLVYWLNWTNRTKKYNCYNDVIERSMLVLEAPLLLQRRHARGRHHEPARDDRRGT